MTDRALRIVVVVVVLFGVLLAAERPAGADCVDDGFSDTPPEAVIGAEVVVIGSTLFCQPACHFGFLGCLPSMGDYPQRYPTGKVVVLLGQGPSPHGYMSAKGLRREWLLGVVSQEIRNEDGRFRLAVRVPKAAQPGEAQFLLRAEAVGRGVTEVFAKTILVAGAIPSEPITAPEPVEVDPDRPEMVLEERGWPMRWIIGIVYALAIGGWLLGAVLRRRPAGRRMMEADPR